MSAFGIGSERRFDRHGSKTDVSPKWKTNARFFWQATATATVRFRPKAAGAKPDNEVFSADVCPGVNRDVQRRPKICVGQNVGLTRPR